MSNRHQRRQTSRSPVARDHIERGTDSAGFDSQTRLLDTVRACTDPAMALKIGNRFERAGKLPAAIACARRAIALQPDFVPARTWLCQALARNAALRRARRGKQR